MTTPPTEPTGNDGPPNADPPRPVYEPTPDGDSLRDRIAVLPGEDRAAYRPGVVLVEIDINAEAFVPETPLQHLADAVLEAGVELPDFDEAERVFAELDGAEDALGSWYKLTGLPDAPEWVKFIESLDFNAGLDYVYFASGSCGCGCPPHPGSASGFTPSPWTANPWTANPWTANPWTANPWTANPWTANPWTANAESLNVAATGKPPTSSAMPALKPGVPVSDPIGVGVVIGVLDSGLAGEVTNDGVSDQMRPEFLISPLISGDIDLPSAEIDGHVDGYLDPVAGHGTFIAGIIQQRVPGCTMHVTQVFFPEGDVSTSWLSKRLWAHVQAVGPSVVNLSFGGAGSTDNGMFEAAIRHFASEGIVFVAAAGNEGTCVEQYPAAMPEVIAVGALGPNGPAPWSNYGPWVDASAPGTDLVSSFFANFDGALPRINGIDADNFEGWATWSGTSFAAPVVVAALAREIATTGCSAKDAVKRVIDAPHLARLPNMGTIVNY